MTKRELVEAYIESALPVFNLKQWKVTVDKSLPPDDSFADIEVSENLYEAKIRLSEDFWKETPDSQRRIIAHELVHIHYAGVERLLDHMEESVGTMVFDIIYKIWDVESERGADSLSTPLAQLLELPKFTEGDSNGSKETSKRKRK
jgi:hypothetical protein